MVRQGAGEVVILLHQENGHFPRFRQTADGPLDVLDDGGLDTFRRLIQNQELGPHGQGPTDGQLLLLTAGEVAATPVQHLFQDREHGENPLWDFAVARAGGQAHEQVFFHRQARENFPALGHVADACLGPLMGGQGSDVPFPEGNAPGFGGQQAHEAFEQGGFAHPVAPQEGGHLAHGNFEIQAPENMATPVVLVQVLNF